MTFDVMRFRRLLLPTLVGTLLLAYVFANVEIQIEGAAGWAAGLPTWRIAPNFWLDLFWGGREMTGYHAWVFPFIALFFHFPFVFFGRWSWRAEARVLGAILTFWISEDFLWFVCNPAYGLTHFTPESVPWHVHWWGAAPTDYWVFLSIAAALFSLSCAAPPHAGSRRLWIRTDRP